jgi:hypothetical protein
MKLQRTALLKHEVKGFRCQWVSTLCVFFYYVASALWKQTNQSNHVGGLPKASCLKYVLCCFVVVIWWFFMLTGKYYNFKAAALP